jgi:hypothetical protein
MNLPKLSKNEIQKLALSVMGFIFLLYVYFNFFLGPLNKTRNAALVSIDQTQKKLDGSKGAIAKTANLERQAKQSTARFAALKALNPEGAPIAWFPPRMKVFFANQQIDKAAARLESTNPFKQPELSAWAKYNWVIDLPQTDFAALGKAVAGLENSEPLVSITKVSIHIAHEQPQYQQVALSVTAVIDKR